MIVAGGINPNHAGNREIEAYVRRVTTDARAKGITVTGFVPERLIGDYFSAADVVVLPYEEFMSSSGPLSLAWAYERPVVWSRELNEYLESDDVKKAVDQVKLPLDRISFGKNRADLVRVLNGVAQQKNAFIRWAQTMQTQRSLESVSHKLIHILEGTEE